jgi:peptidoglycan/LPS O-acetylase OafA/YrhL
MSPATQRIDYFPALTGLRGVAAGLVLLHHAWQFAGGPAHTVGSGWLSYPLHAPGAVGFMGVDLFFVLSGFLLALPFLSAVRGARSWPSLRVFYQRRALRVLPAFWGQLAILALAGWLFAAVPNLDPLSILVHALFLQELFPRMQPINPVYWSLPVEWWFYFWLPVLCALFLRARWWMILALVLVWAICFRVQCIAWLYEWRQDLFSNFGAIDGLRARIDEFFLGILAAWFHLRVPRDSPWRVRALLAALALMVLGAPWIMHELPTWLSPSRLWTYIHYSVAGAVFALLVFGAAGGGALARRLFAGRVMTWLGLVSYSLYLWHYPLLTGARGAGLMDRLGAVPATLLVMAASLGVAWASWRFIERPFLRDEAGVPRVAPKAAVQPSA